MVGTKRCDMGKTKKSPDKSTKYATSGGHSYFTKRILVSKARSAGRKAASNAMDVMGFVVTNWFRKYYSAKVV